MVTAASLGKGDHAPTTRNKFHPVRWWAGVGAFFVALILYMWGTWLFSGHAVPTHTGSTPVPTSVKVAVHLQEVVFMVLAAIVFYRFLIKPWRREGRLTAEGMWIIAWLTAFMVQDPWINYTRPVFTYNAEMFNLGCPQCHVPGWQASSIVAPEPIFWDVGLYIFGLAGGVILCGHFMRWYSERNTRIGKFGVGVAAFAFCMVLDAVGETIMLAVGTYAYPGSIPAFSWSGGKGTMPVYEALTWGSVMGAVACIRYFKDDRGNTIVERGIDKLQMTEGKKQGLRLLAMIATTNLAFLLLYNVPWQWFDTHAGNWPAEVVNSSYLNGRFCGVDTDRMCPGPHVPMPVGNESAYVTPEGTLKAPYGFPSGK